MELSIFYEVLLISDEKVVNFLNKRDKFFSGLMLEMNQLNLITIIFVTWQIIWYKVINCWKWKEIFTATAAMPCAVRKSNALRINIIL